MPESMRVRFPREYQSWVSARARCNNPKHTSYRNYGLRGIRVCARWDSFAAFLTDMGPCPPGHTLDRVKTNLGYWASNCRWATPKEQLLNRRNTLRLTYRGETKPLLVWANELQVEYATLRTRIMLGWSVERAFNTPVGKVSKTDTKTKRRAYTALHKAIRLGEIVRPDRCEECKRKVVVQGHHHLGYDPPHDLDVQWLCISCHRRAEAVGTGRFADVTVRAANLRRICVRQASR